MTSADSELQHNAVWLVWVAVLSRHIPLSALTTDNGQLKPDAGPGVTKLPTSPSMTFIPAVSGPGQ